MKTAIIGGGFSGLAAGIKTGAPIYEASEHAGGICRDYTIDGFEFSSGGPHWLFGQNEAIEYVRGILPLKSYERRAGVYYNAILPYPIQTFANRKHRTNYGSYKYWVDSKFSNDLCNLFFHPFNEKYIPDLYDEVLPFDTYKTPSPGQQGHVVEFHNPVGGLNALVKKFTEKNTIHYNKTAIKIDTKNKTVFFQDGTVTEYDNLISTIPLDKCLILCGQKDFDLPFTSVYVINIGAERGRNFPREHWLYVPFCKTGFHRAGFYTNVDETKAPKDKVSLSIELAFSGWDRDDLDEPFIMRNVIEELQAWGWIEDVIVCDPTWVKCAYTYFRKEGERERHLKWLADNDILSIGRYGKWKFQGICESIQDGLSL